MADHLRKFESKAGGHRVRQVEVDRDGGDVLGCKAHLAGGTNVTHVQVDAKVMLSAVLAHCRGLGIPLAAIAEKRLEMSGDLVALVTTMNALRPVRQR